MIEKHKLNRIIMQRCGAVRMRKSLESVDLLKKSGIEFVPIPVMDDDDRAKLLGILMQRVEKIAIQQEKEDVA